MTEEWKMVAYTDKPYEISNLGRVRNAKNGRVLHPMVKDGYLRVDLSVNGKTRHIRVHRLVAASFIPNPRGLNEINHIDGNKKNNSVENLEWCTHQENMRKYYAAK